MNDLELINKYKNYKTSTKIIRTKFLSTYQKQLLKEIINKDKSIYFFGGFNNSEREVAYINSNSNELDFSLIDFNVALYEIKYNKKFLTLTNKNILGTLISLGLNREVIGDIYVYENKGYFAICKDIERYVLESFTNINNVPIKLEKKTEKIEKIILYQYKKLTLTSLRLDLFIAHSFNINREIAKKLIESNLVKVNQKIINSSSYLLKTKDLISVRGKGRFIINDIIGKSKKDKYIVMIGINK